MTTTDLEPEVWLPSVVINDASWELYEKLLKAVGNQNLRLTYDEGVLEIMSPLPEHERIKSQIGRFVEMMTLELNIPLACLGSTTFKRKSLLKGLEPNECYYIQNEAVIRAKKRLDLRRDPPPDLAIEVDLSHRTVDKRPIYAAMKTPEIWSYETSTGELECLHLRRGKYERHETSLAFPFFRPAEMERFIRMLGETDETSIVRAWQNWVRKKLLRQSKRNGNGR